MLSRLSGTPSYPSGGDQECAIVTRLELQQGPVATGSSSTHQGGMVLRPYPGGSRILAT